MSARVCDLNLGWLIDTSFVMARMERIHLNAYI